MNVRWLVVLIACAGVAGCKVSVEPDREAQRQVEQAGEVAKDAASKAGSRAVEGVQKAATDLSTNAKNATRQTMNTAAIKAAFSNRKDLDTSKVDVATVGMKVTLKGTVAGADQRSKIEELARTVAGPEYTIESELKVPEN